MNDSPVQLIEVERLRVGMFVHLDLGWMAHPFPFGSFKIKSQDQIDIIRSLGVPRVRYAPNMSDDGDQSGSETAAAMATPAAAVEAPEQTARRERSELLAEQQASLERCERQFRDASKSYRNVLQSVFSQPELARAEAEKVVDGMFQEMAESRESAIRLLSEKAGEESALHAMNVTVLSLLLGRACGLDEAALRHLGSGALLHDIGKLEIPDRMRFRDQKFTPAERRLYEDHVEKGEGLAKKMGLPEPVRAVISQHHELDDGSGFPLGLKGSAIAQGARIVALVNHYDNLCNPPNPALALTPHDALAVTFAKMRARFDSSTIATFIRMMGVYPPGSVIQLTDSRYALSVSVNASRPLKPRVIVYDTSVEPEHAIVIDLEAMPEIGVRRSLKPLQLPRDVFDYLSPRKRMCYFFERSRESGETASAGA